MKLYELLNETDGYQMDVNLLESDERLDEFVMFLPLLATALRMGVPILMKMATSQGSKVVAQQVLRKTAQTGGKVLLQTGKSMVKNPVKALGVAGAIDAAPGALESYEDAKALWEKYKGTIAVIEKILAWFGLQADKIAALAPIIKQYSIPFAGVAAILYGGKKLYDYVQTNKDVKVETNKPEDELILNKA
ncbi:MAG: hypothetical protein DRH57_07740 [Candidatus Cloacimonadota bacterium]|nr:MAG: hypothetical protein DRH57_07740 [Candidatus Cloacimonadota bacterium]